MADFPWNNNFGTPTPAPAPVDDSEPVNEAGQADDSENWSASDEDSQPDVRQGCQDHAAQDREEKLVLPSFGSRLVREDQGHARRSFR